MDCEQCISRKYITKNPTLLNKVNSAGISVIGNDLSTEGKASDTVKRMEENYHELI